MEQHLVTVLVALLLIQHLGHFGVPLARSIISSLFELLEFAIERAVTFRERWQTAKTRWRAAG